MALAAGLLEQVEAGLDLEGFAREGDGAAAQADDFCRRHIWGGGLIEGFESVEAKVDDVGSEVKFLVGFRMVGGEK